MRRAQILLKADADGPNWTDERIAEAFSCRTQTVEKMRQRLVERGFEETLQRSKRAQPPIEKLLDGEQEAQHHRHATRTAAERLCQLDAAAAGTQGRGVGDRGLGELRNGAAHAKKNGMTNRKIEYWVIPPEADGEFVAHMEEVLETYEKPYDPACPVLCMDEQPVQLLKETRVADPRHGQARQAGRLRIRASRHGQHLHVRRAAGRLA